MQEFAHLLAADQIRGEREYQEDSFRITSFHRGDQLSLLLVMADGLGGYTGGARASALAVETFIKHFGEDDGAVGDRLERALMAANQAIANDRAADPGLAHMGSTFLACWLEGDVAHWISVGDCSLYCLRGGELLRLNDDHSMRPVLQGMVDVGRLTAGQMQHDPRRSQLRSALTGERISLIDQSDWPFALQSGDRLLLASDGLEILDEARMAKLLGGLKQPNEAVSALLGAVEVAGVPGQGNASVIVYEHQQGGLDGELAPADAFAAAAQSPSANELPAPKKRGFLRRLFGG